ncbi:hypothetical protein [Microbacterium sp. YY-01]|uniref:hypothetical protein n=1 Tax=Microbacterium sp. YY-01 TaxID=3421634 RepID=UPI003D1690CF
MSTMTAGLYRWAFAAGAIMALSVGGCAGAGEASPSDTPTPAAETVPTETAPRDTTEQTPDAVPQASGDDSDAGCQNVMFDDAAEIPAILAENDVPFYPCTHKMTGVQADDPLFVGEFVTEHELTIVNMVVRDQFEASGWEIVDRTVDGQNTVNQARKDGLFLVLVVGPERTDDFITSLHYTLRRE